jgi:hypothetical protein
MSQRDLDLYAGMAYGTPFEPYIRGRVAYGTTEPVRFDKNSMIASEPKPVPPSDDTRQRYASVFRRSLQNPSLALGSDDPQRLGMVPNGIWFPGLKGLPSLPLWDRAMGRLIGLTALGAYARNGDVAVSMQPFWETPGTTDAHEMMHRGLNRAGIPASRHHDLINSQTARENGLFGSDIGTSRGLLDNPELDAAQQAAVNILYARRPWGGPR